jgi:hypothetical protein
VKCVVGVVALIVLVSACRSSHGHSASSTAETSSTALPGVTVEQASMKLPPLTTQQLRAHLGSDLPPGWTPVDYGDARLWVPPTWRIVFGNCDAPAHGFVQTDTSYGQSCSNKTTVIKLDPLTTTNVPGRPSATIHGYRLFATGPNTYAVPALHVTLTVKGTDSSRVLSTLAPSSRTVALTYRRAAPRGWRTVTHAGVSLRVPSKWALEDITGKPVCPNPRLNAAVLVGHGLPAGCGVDPTFAVPVVGSAGISDPLRRPVPSPTTTVDSTSYDAPWYSTHLQLDVRVDPGHNVAVTIGLGRDGRIGADIIASVQAVTSSSG